MKFSSDDGAIDILTEDVQLTLKLISEDDNQFHRRIYIRALFSYLEGFTFLARQMMIELDKERFEDTGYLDYEKHLLLQEKFPAIGNNGTIKKGKHLVSSIRSVCIHIKINERLI